MLNRFSGLHLIVFHIILIGWTNWLNIGRSTSHLHKSLQTAFLRKIDFPSLWWVDLVWWLGWGLLFVFLWLCVFFFFRGIKRHFNLLVEYRDVLISLNNIGTPSIHNENYSMRHHCVLLKKVYNFSTYWNVRHSLQIWDLLQRSRINIFCKCFL